MWSPLYLLPLGVYIGWLIGSVSYFWLRLRESGYPWNWRVLVGPNTYFNWFDRQH